MITTMYDDLAFPTAEEDKAKFQVVDDHGKTVTVPHPVTGLRVWNGKGYDVVEATLDGAPKTAEDTAKAWEELLVELGKKIGEETLAELRTASS